MIFRREMPQIMNEGGLWEESSQLYPLLGAKPRISDVKWVLPNGWSVRFAHLEHEQDVLKWQGAQVPFIGFDELTHFSSYQFFYMLSRNRSATAGFKPYMRATCNPDATSWVKQFLAPWVDRANPIRAESGELLWMVRLDGLIHWHKTFEEAVETARPILAADPMLRPENIIKSVTFVAASIYDNQKLLQKDPGYLGNLLALPQVEQRRLLYGDWDVLPDAGKVFDRAWFRPVTATPEGDDKHRAWECRFWDFAATVQKTKGDDPDYTAGVKLRKHRNRYYVTDLWVGRIAAAELERTVRNVAEQDGRGCVVRWEEEGGASGKFLTQRMVEVLGGFDAAAVRPQGDKLSRAQPAAAQAEAGNVDVLKAPWNERFLTEVHHFPDAAHDDCVDAFSGAFRYLEQFGADVTFGPDLWSM